VNLPLGIFKRGWVVGFWYGGLLFENSGDFLEGAGCRLIRVVEDIMRYRDNNKELSTKLKELRHKARIEETLELLLHRDSINDVLRPTITSELNRTDILSIIKNYIK